MHSGLKILCAKGYERYEKIGTTASSSSFTTIEGLLYSVFEEMKMCRMAYIEKNIH